MKDTLKSLLYTLFCPSTFSFSTDQVQQNIAKKVGKKYTPPLPHPFPQLNARKITTAKNENWDITLSDTTAAKATVIYISCLDTHHP